MPHERDLLHLEPSPASARQARTIVASRLRDLGREDLLDSASLVVSELVTNALLHAGDSITLRVRGTARRPRIEVGDSSMGLPRLPDQVDELGAVAVPDDPAVGDDALLTYGRGVRLVQIHSAAWGVDRSSGSKVVWFEPAADPRPRARNEIQVYEIGEQDPLVPPGRQPSPEESVEASAPTGAPVSAAVSHRRVRLLHAPVRLIDSVRRHYDELQREIRLIGLQYGTERSALPRELFEQASRPDLHRLRAVGTEQVAAALEAGVEFTDLDYLVTPESAAEFEHTIDLLLQADDFCRREQLLTLALSDDQLAAVQWFVGQIVAQVDGAEPSPWRERLVARG